MQKKYNVHCKVGTKFVYFTWTAGFKQTINMHQGQYELWRMWESLQLRELNGCHSGIICLAGICHTPSAERRRDWRPAPSNEVTPGTLGLISLSRIGPIRQQMSNKYVGPMWGYLRSWNTNNKLQPTKQPYNSRRKRLQPIFRNFCTAEKSMIPV